MASRYLEKDPVKCWNLLALVLSYGHTIPFVYSKEPQQYRISEGMGGWGYYDLSCAEYLMEDIQFALFTENCEKIYLNLSGRDNGPICDDWTFIFTKEGLVSAENFYNTD